VEAVSKGGFRGSGDGVGVLVKDMVAHFVVTIKVKLILTKANIVSGGLEDKGWGLGVDGGVVGWRDQDGGGGRLRVKYSSSDADRGSLGVNYSQSWGR